LLLEHRRQRYFQTLQISNKASRSHAVPYCAQCGRWRNAFGGGLERRRYDGPRSTRMRGVGVVFLRIKVDALRRIGMDAAPCTLQLAAETDR
jgi:hypothetical protein